MANGEIDDLVDEYGKAVVQQAFALQEHIKDHGIEGVRFMETAEQKTQARKWHVAKKNLRKNIPRRP